MSSTIIESAPKECSRLPDEFESDNKWKYETAGTVPVKRLQLDTKDEEARLAAPIQAGYCVDELCSCKNHRCIPTKPPLPFEATSTYRQEFAPKLSETIYYSGLKKLYGPDGIPIGVDPKKWQEYVAKNGMPKMGQIPAHLYYKSNPETRDFTTESRLQYCAKRIDPTLFQLTKFDADGIPLGINKKAWADYLKKHGFPADGKIPSWLYAESQPETRDFSTVYRSNYTPHMVTTCPVTKLPNYPMPKWPREHTFWDPIAKQWY